MVGAAVMDRLQVSCQSLQILQILSSNHSAGHPRRAQTERIVFALPTQDASNGVLFFGLVLGVVLSSLLDGPQTGPKKFRAFWAPNLGRFWNHVGAISDDFCVFFRHLNLRPL